MLGGGFSIQIILVEYNHIYWWGFSSGIHNIMEPAVASNPVVFGPRHQKFSEAELIIKLGVVLRI
ncbi:MAG: hypothetical protein CM15mP44_8910 [Candidatus Neomarinimicrobiota bacterium]|nr:MAG: hypothetical protein CM15mP44_8910 [Candidatus Neomarinimicrobiota bacterium]